MNKLLASLLVIMLIPACLSAEQWTSYKNNRLSFDYPQGANTKFTPGHGNAFSLEVDYYTGDKDSLSTDMFGYFVEYEQMKISVEELIDMTDDDAGLLVNEFKKSFNNKTVGQIIFDKPQIERDDSGKIKRVLCRLTVENAEIKKVFKGIIVLVFNQSNLQMHFGMSSSSVTEAMLHRVMESVRITM